MSWLTNLFSSNGVTSLDLKRDMPASSTVIRPTAPPLDVSYMSMLNYSRKNELVYACIEKKAQAACDAEFVVETRTADGWEATSDHPLVTLLNKPNPYDDGESFRRSWIASENFADYFFCEIVRSRAGQPVGLYPLHPAYIVPMYKFQNGVKTIDYYSYQVEGMEIKYQPKDLLIRRRHSLGSVYAGISALYVALGSVDADTAWTDYVRAFFNNGGMPSVVIAFKNRTLSEEDVQRYQQKWTQKYGRYGVNQGGPAIIDNAEVDVNQLGSQLDELASDTLTEIQETRICMAFGVPPVLIGAYVGLKNVNQKASFAGAMTEFWENTMSPELKSIRNFLTWNLLPEWEDVEKIKRGEIRVNWDLSQVKALQEDVDAIHKRTQEDFKSQIITRDEARQKIGFDALEGEIGEAFFKPVEPKVEDKPEDEDKPPPKQLFSGKLEDVQGLGQGRVNENGHYVNDIIDAEIILEKKTFNFDGLTLGRQPTALEMTLDLKGMVEDYDNGKEQMSAILISLRSDLIGQVTEAVSQLDSDSVYELILVPPPKAYSRIRKSVDNLFNTGRRQVEKQAGGTKKTGDTWEEFLSRIVDMTVSRLINEIQTRAVNIFTALGLLGLEDNEILRRLERELEEQSLKAFEDMAAQTANSAIGAGRDAEIEARSDEWEVVEYSAILDANTCSPCEEADGMTGASSADLPDAPNPDCEGGARCRCFHVAVFKEQTA